MDSCSFCGKSEKFAVRLVRGPEVAICEECVKLAVEVLEDMPEVEHPEPTRRLRLFGESSASGFRRADPDR